MRAAPALLAVGLASIVAVSSAYPAFSPQFQSALDDLAAASTGAEALDATRAVHTAMMAQANDVYGWIEAASAANATKVFATIRALPSTTDPHPVLASLSNKLYTDLDAWLTDAYDFLNFAFAAIWTRLDQVFSSGVSIPYAAWGETDALDATTYPVVDGINDRAYVHLDVEMSKLYLEVDSVNPAEWESFKARVNDTGASIDQALSTLDTYTRTALDNIVSRCQAAADAVEADTTTPLSSLYDTLSTEYVAVDSAATVMYDHVNEEFLTMYDEWGRRWHTLYTFADANFLQQPFYELVDSRSEQGYRDTDRLNDDLYVLADIRIESCYMRLDQASGVLDSRWMTTTSPARAAAAPVSVASPVVVQTTLSFDSVTGSGVPAAAIVCDKTHTGASVQVTFDETGDKCTAPCGTPIVCARPAGLDASSETPVTITVTSNGVGETRVAPRDGSRATSGHRARTPNVVRISTYATTSGSAPASLLLEASGGDGQSGLNAAASAAPTLAAAAAVLVAAVAAIAA